jgi:uncharacterized protein (TIRG00374 family)
MSGRSVDWKADLVGKESVMPEAVTRPVCNAQTAKVVRLLLPAIVTIAALAAIAWYAIRHREQWSAMRIVHPSMLALCAVAAAAALLSPGPIFWLTTRRVGHKISLLESTCLAIVGTAIDMVVPFHSGTAARAMYLKKRHDLDLAKFASMFLGYNVVRLLAASGLAALAATGFVSHSAGSASLRGLAAVTTGLFAMSAVGCVLLPACMQWLANTNFSRTRLGRGVLAFTTGWLALMGSPGFFVQVLGLVVLQIATELAVVWTAWAAVGVVLTPAAAVLITTCGILTSLTGLTPGGLGIVEVVTATVGSAVALDPMHAIAAGLVARGIVVAVAAELAAMAAIWLSKEDRQRRRI